MTDLIPPHGGLAEPVDRTVPAPERAAFLAEAATLPRVPVSDADLSSVYRFADGTLSPLEGPMDAVTYHRVLDAAVIVATLDLTDVYPWDKRKYLRSVYQTDRVDHPGADMVLKADADKTHLLGGTIRALPQPPHPAFGRYLRTPREVRALLRAKGWNRAVAFQTRNPLHRAHEYALVYALETLLRAGYNAGAALMPLVGETKEDDVRAEVRMRTYEALLETRALGDGDSDPALWGPRGESVPDRVILLGLDIKMFYGGPKEAVMHAIYRQNFGFTDLVVGRRHADAPYHDGTSIWGDFDAQEIFGQLRGALGIQPLKVGFAAYYESVGRVDLMDLHPDEKPVF